MLPLLQRIVELKTRHRARSVCLKAEQRFTQPQSLSSRPCETRGSRPWPPLAAHAQWLRSPPDPTSSFPARVPPTVLLPLEARACLSSGHSSRMYCLRVTMYGDMFIYMVVGGRRLTKSSWKICVPTVYVIHI